MEVTGAPSAPGTHRRVGPHGDDHLGRRCCGRINRGGTTWYAYLDGDDHHRRARGARRLYRRVDRHRNDRLGWISSYLNTGGRYTP